VTTTTPAADYRAVTDPTLKTWHLSTVQRGNACFCGTKLIYAEDTRKVALKLPAEKRNFEASEDLAKVTCGACKRTRDYAAATSAATRPAGTAPRVRRAPAAKPKAVR
jgi:hypothetical protein